MATSFGTVLPTIVVYRVHRQGACVLVRMFIGLDALIPRAEMLLLPSEFRLWRATLLDFAPNRFSLWYGEGVFEWLASLAPLNPEAVPQ